MATEDGTSSASHSPDDPPPGSGAHDRATAPALDILAALIQLLAAIGALVGWLVVVGGVSDVRIPAEQYPFYLAALFLFPLGNRTVAAWLYNRSGNSVPVAGLTHAAWNLAAGSALLPALVPGFDPVWSYAGFAAAAVVVIVLTRGRLGYSAASHP